MDARDWKGKDGGGNGEQDEYSVQYYSPSAYVDDSSLPTSDSSFLSYPQQALPQQPPQQPLITTTFPQPPPQPQQQQAQLQMQPQQLQQQPPQQQQPMMHSQSVVHQHMVVQQHMPYVPSQVPQQIPISQQHLVPPQQPLQVMPQYTHVPQVQQVPLPQMAQVQQAVPQVQPPVVHQFPVTPQPYPYTSAIQPFYLPQDQQMAQPPLQQPTAFPQPQPQMQQMEPPGAMVTILSSTPQIEEVQLRRYGDSLGIEVHNETMRLVHVREGIAMQCGLAKYVNWQVTHVNGKPCTSVTDILATQGDQYTSIRFKYVSAMEWQQLAQQTSLYQQQAIMQQPQLQVQQQQPQPQQQQQQQQQLAQQQQQQPIVHGAQQSLMGSIAVAASPNMSIASQPAIPDPTQQQQVPSRWPTPSSQPRHTTPPPQQPCYPLEAPQIPVSTMPPPVVSTPDSVPIEPTPKAQSGRPGGEKKYVGKVKSYHTERGYGFIRCNALYDEYKRDVFLHKMQAAGVEIGSTVQFEIDFNKDKHPQARAVTVIAGPSDAGHGNKPRKGGGKKNSNSDPVDGGTKGHDGVHQKSKAASAS